jgi:tetratricopeptide (TPR) repeat protein
MLAELLEVDQSYISRLETGRRDSKDIELRKSIVDRLLLPPELLGLAPEDYGIRHVDELLQLVTSVVRLASLARNAGRADEAVAELHPLAARLQLQTAVRPPSSDLLLAIAGVKAALGTALGDLLPEDQLHVSAGYLADAWEIAAEVGNDTLRSDILRKYGNELRKVGKYSLAVEHLEHAITVAPDASARGAAAGCLARAYALMGDVGKFTTAMATASSSLDSIERHTATHNPSSVEEIELRGLVDLGRTPSVGRLLRALKPVDHLASGVAPQWLIIREVTVAEARLTIDDVAGGLDGVSKALAGAEAYRLPHQVQRVMRALQPMGGSSDDERVLQTYQDARSLVDRLCR